jgi:hypothetical protein
VYVILRAVDNLNTILAPVLPHTAQQLQECLGYEGQLFGTQQVVEYQEETRSHQALTYDHAGAIGTWAASELPPGQALREPARCSESWMRASLGKCTRGWGEWKVDEISMGAGIQVPAPCCYCSMDRYRQHWCVLVVRLVLVWLSPKRR